MSKELEYIENQISTVHEFKERFEKQQGIDTSNVKTISIEEFIEIQNNSLEILHSIKSSLQRLEQIDNSKPSEALECLEEIGKTLMFTDYETLESKTLSEVMPNYYRTIKQALIKSQEQEKVLKIIKEYQVDIWLLKQCDYENYIRIRKEAMVSIGQIVNEDGIILEDEIPQEEFDLLKRWTNEEKD